MEYLPSINQYNHNDPYAHEIIIWLKENQDYLSRKLEEFTFPNYIIIGGRTIYMDQQQKEKIRAWNYLHHNTEFLSYDDLMKKASELLENLKNLD